MILFNQTASLSLPHTLPSSSPPNTRFLFFSFPLIITTVRTAHLTFVDDDVYYVLQQPAAVRTQEEIPRDPNCFPPPLLFACFVRRHTSPIDWFTLSIDIDIIKRYVTNTITATSIQIKVGVQLPTPSYGTGSTAWLFVSFRH